MEQEINISTKTRNQRGFSVLVIVFIIIALGAGTVAYLAGNVLDINQGRIEESKGRIQKATQTLLDFQLSKGYYPCPARLDLIPGDSGFGVESAPSGASTDCATLPVIPPGGVVDVTGVRIGMLPFKTLGLSQDYAADEWGNKLLYAVTRDLTKTPNFGIGRLEVLDENGVSRVTPPGTAPFIVISHGKDGKGAYPFKSAAQKYICKSGGLDDENCDDDEVFVDAPLNAFEGVATAAYFDDIASGVWSATGGTGPDPFCFPDKINQPLNTWVESDPAILANFVGPLDATGSPGIEASRNGGPYAAVVNGFMPGDTIKIRIRSANTYLTPVSGTVTVGTTTSCGGTPWVVTTVPDNQPDPFSFIDQSGVPLSTVIQSNSVALTGFNGPLSGTGSAGVEVERNGDGVWNNTIAGFMPGDTIRIRRMSPTVPATSVTGTVTVGATTSGVWTLTEGTDTTPDPFAFNNEPAAPPATVITSNSVTVTGFDGPLNATASPGMLVARNGGAFGGTATGFMPGDTIQIRTTSDPTPGVSVLGTVTLGGTTSSPWMVTTAGAPPSDPDPFGFVDQNNVPLNTDIASNTVTLTGFTGPLNAFGSAGVKISRNGGPFTVMATGFMPGDTIAIQMRSAATGTTPVVGDVTVGGTTSSPWTITTAAGASDGDPDPFGFTAVGPVTITSQQTSNTVTISGYDATTTATASPGCTVSVNGGAYMPTVNNIAPPSATLTLRCTSGGDGEVITGSVTVGSTVGDWQITSCDVSPDFVSLSNITDAEWNTVYRNSFSVSGITCDATASMETNGKMKVKRSGFGTVCGWTRNNCTVQNGDIVKMKRSTGDVGGETKTTSLSIGSTSFSWDLTTRIADPDPVCVPDPMCPMPDPDDCLECGGSSGDPLLL